MATVHGTLEQPLEEAGVAVRRVAGQQGWTLSEAHSDPDLLVFKKGARVFSWGSQINVKLEQQPSTTETRLTLSTVETWAITDWGRGRRAARRLLEGLGAREDEGG